MRYWFLCLAILTTNAGVTEAEVKSYNERTDRCSIEAELIALERGWVELRSADGRAISVPFSELSKADQRYVRDHLRTGHPLGSVRFVERLEQAAGRVLRPRRPGRPAKLPNHPK